MSGQGTAVVLDPFDIIPSGQESTLQNYSIEKSTDIIFYSGPIYHSGLVHLMRRLPENPQNTKLLLYLTTYGGDPRIAYLFARFLQKHYPHISTCVIGPCVSAGTLICLAANTLYMSDLGHLGPIDLQRKKSDDLGYSSVTETFNAMNFLSSYAQRILSDTVDAILARGIDLTIKSSYDYGVKLTIGLLAPIFNQISPTALGEFNRALNWSGQMSEKLLESSQLTPDPYSATKRLILDYQSHEFPIDFNEAKVLLGDNVKPLEGDELTISNICSNFLSEQEQEVRWAIVHNTPPPKDETLENTSAQSEPSSYRDHQEGDGEPDNEAGNSPRN